MAVIKTMFSQKASKAFVAGMVAAISSATIAAPEGFTTTEILTILGALVVAFQATYWVTNAKGDPDGIIQVLQPVLPGGKKTYSMELNSDPDDLDTKKEVIFKINK